MVYWKVGYRYWTRPTRSWSEDFNLKESMRLLVLVRVQSIEEAAP